MLMAAHTKTPEMIAKMREAAGILVGLLEMIGDYVKPGVSTGELDRICHDYIVAHGGVPSCVGYMGYAHATCISVNHVVCHGIPGDKILKDGDILNIDVVASVDGLHADTSAMFCAGTPGRQAKRLCEVTQQALYLGIAAVRPGATLGDIGAAIGSHAQKNGFSVVRDFCGHGIGRKMHEEPQVEHTGRRGEGQMLVPGMTFTIEPMLNAGTREVRVLADRWTVVTRDHQLSAQWEHTVLVTESGHEVLTLRPSESAAFATA